MVTIATGRSEASGIPCPAWMEVEAALSPLTSAAATSSPAETLRPVCAVTTAPAPATMRPAADSVAKRPYRMCPTPGLFLLARNDAVDAEGECERTHPSTRGRDGRGADRHHRPEKSGNARPRRDRFHV